MAEKKWVYSFDEVNLAEQYSGNWEGVRGLLGGKGSGLKFRFHRDLQLPQRHAMLIKP
jgi:hypothetical protein